MGFSIAWVAIQSRDEAAVLRAVNATSTADVDEFFESELAGVRLRGGWYLLVAQGCDSPLVSDDSLAMLSCIAPLIACSVEEHVMFSSSRFWRAGTEIWSVSHDAQKDLLDLVTAGEVPAVFADISARVFESQKRESGGAAEVDFVFDAPLLLAKHLTGYKHDDSPNCFDDALPVRLEQAIERGKPWWKFW